MSANVNPQLTPRQRVALTALLSAPSVKAAARELKVADRTLYRWLEEPVFRQALQDAEEMMMDETNRLLLAGRSKALHTLMELMDKAMSEQVRRQAACDWLDLWLKVRELRDMEKRITELEDRLNVNKN